MSIDINTLITIIDNGRYYCPAWAHYARKTTVQCDKCQLTPIEECIGYEKYDICMACAKTISTYKNRNLMHQQDIYFEPRQEMRTRMEISTFRPRVTTQMETSIFQQPMQTKMESSRFRRRDNDHLTYMESRRFSTKPDTPRPQASSSEQLYETDMEQEYFKTRNDKKGKKDTEPFSL